MRYAQSNHEVKLRCYSPLAAEQVAPSNCCCM